MDWFTSDTHFGHAKVLLYDNRPFTSIEQHDEVLIEKWNYNVKPTHTVYHVGDVGWSNKVIDYEKLLSRLNGHKFLITGNHDQVAAKAKGWSGVYPYKEIKINKQHIVLFHYRMVVWNNSHYGSWALHGHSHGTLPVILTAKTLDVGTMLWNYRPINFDEVKAEMDKRTFEPVDHHGMNKVMILED